METGPDLEEAAHSSVELRFALGRVVTLDRTFSSVDFPAPFRPTIPTTSPWLMSALTSRRAQNASCASPDLARGWRIVRQSVSVRRPYGS